jgi:hypothetical protein
MKITPSDVIALVSAVVATLALCVAYITYRGTIRSASRPVLIFSISTGFRWKIQNVGAGPALNVIVADRHLDGRNDSVTICYPLAAGADLELVWIKAGHELVAVYTDIFGYTFTSVCRANRNTFSTGNTFPELSPDTEQWLQEVLGVGREYSQLTEEDFKGKTPWQLDLMRNELYARRGYIFKKPEFRQHFAEQEWYQPVTANHGKVYREMSAREKYEAHLILDYQRRNGLFREPPK